MKRFGKILAVILALLVLAFLVFRTTDTDPAAMRAKYGPAPSQFVELEGGLTVHLRDEGPRRAPVIMLIHGSSADLHTWDPWADRLKDDYRIIRFDQIGHGLTGPAPDGDYSMPAFVETVDLVADKLGVKSFVLAGSSMGGAVAFSYALVHPDRLNGLVLVDASGAPVEQQGGGNIGFTIARMPVINNLMTQITPRSIIEQSIAQSVENKSIVTPEAVDRYWELLRYPGNRAATLARFGQARNSFTVEQAQKITVPTLIMWGKEDRLVPFEAAGWFAKWLPDSTSVSYPATGHIPAEERPDQSANDLRGWLGELRLTSSVAN